MTDGRCFRAQDEGTKQESKQTTFDIWRRENSGYTFSGGSSDHQTQSQVLLSPTQESICLILHCHGEEKRERERECGLERVMWRRKPRWGMDWSPSPSTATKAANMPSGGPPIISSPKAKPSSSSMCTTTPPPLPVRCHIIFCRSLSF